MSDPAVLDASTQAFQDEVGSYVRGESSPQDAVLKHLVEQFKAAQGQRETVLKNVTSYEQVLLSARGEAQKLAGRVDGLAEDMRHFWNLSQESGKTQKS